MTYQTISRLLKVFACISFGFCVVTAFADNTDNSGFDGRPELESYGSYGEFQQALKSWQDQQMEKQGELPSQKGALSNVDIVKLHNAFKHRTVYIKPLEVIAVPKKENLNAAIHKAPKLKPGADDSVSLSNNPNLQASDNSNLSATAIAGALGATAAGANGPVVQSKLQGNVDSQSALNNVSSQQRGQQNTNLPTNNAYIMTTSEGTSSLPGSSAVNIVQRIVTNSSMPTLPH